MGYIEKHIILNQKQKNILKKRENKQKRKVYLKAEFGYSKSDPRLTQALDETLTNNLYQEWLLKAGDSETIKEVDKLNEIFKLKAGETFDAKTFEIKSLIKDLYYKDFRKFVYLVLGIEKKELRAYSNLILDFLVELDNEKKLDDIGFLCLKLLKIIHGDYSIEDLEKETQVIFDAVKKGYVDLKNSLSNVILEAYLDTIWLNIYKFESVADLNFIMNLFLKLGEIKYLISPTRVDNVVGSDLLRYGFLDGEKGYLEEIAKLFNLYITRQKIDGLWNVKMNTCNSLNMNRPKQYMLDNLDFEELNKFYEMEFDEVLLLLFKLNKTESNEEKITIIDNLNQLINIESVFDINDTCYAYLNLCKYLYITNNIEDIKLFYQKFKLIYEQIKSGDLYKEKSKCLNNLNLQGATIDREIDTYAIDNKVAIFALLAGDIGYAMSRFFDAGAKDVSDEDRIKIVRKHVNLEDLLNQKKVSIASDQFEPYDQFYSQVGVIMCYLKLGQVANALKITNRLIQSVINTEENDIDNNDTIEKVLYYDTEAYHQIGSNTDSNLIQIDPAHIPGLIQKLKYMTEALRGSEMTPQDAYNFLLENFFGFYGAYYKNKTEE